ncbi:vomeronasal type-2 receptor 116-like [Oryctolagus cuniculus]|uniref:vomeronasal type-2 receptor 116-like n=1 Tax=Oryctolagus cuniculus TaxID=9986 RepID=UPI0038781544
MANSDNSLVCGMHSLLPQFGWISVVLFISNDMKGEQFLQNIEAEMVKKGVCLAYSEKLPDTKSRYAETEISCLEVINISSANVHILYGDVRSLYTIEFLSEFYLTLEKVWIIDAKWDIVVLETQHMLHFVHGGFSSSHHKGETPGLEYIIKTVDMGRRHDSLVCTAECEELTGILHIFMLSYQLSSKGKGHKKHGVLWVQNNRVQLSLEQFFFLPSNILLKGLPWREYLSLTPTKIIHSHDYFGFQITYGPFDPLLSDKDRFPSLYQMATSDSSVVHGMISLLLHFGWTWVALFVSDDMKGEQFLRYFETEMVKKGLCVAFTQKLPATKRLYASTDITFMTGISLSSANVHILYGEVRSLINVDFAGEYFLTVGKVWIMVAKWNIVVHETYRALHSFHGGFSFSPRKGEIPGLKHFLKTVDPSHYPEDFYFTKLWFHIFTCLPSGSLCGEIGDCPPNTSLEFSPGDIDIMTISDSSYFIYNAVYAVAHTLHKMFLEKMEMGSLGDAAQPKLLPWQLHPLLKKIQFRNSAGYDISFHETRHDVVQYDIQNIVNFPVGLGLMVNIGKFFSKSSHDQALVINEEMIEWPIAFKKVWIPFNFTDLHGVD